MDWSSGGGPIPVGPGKVPPGPHAPGLNGGVRGSPVRAGYSFVPVPIEAIGRPVGDHFEEQAGACPARPAARMPRRTVRHRGPDREASRIARAVRVAAPAGGPVAILMGKDAPKLAAVSGDHPTHILQPGHARALARSLGAAFH